MLMSKYVVDLHIPQVSALQMTYSNATILLLLLVSIIWENTYTQSTFSHTYLTYSATSQ